MTWVVLTLCLFLSACALTESESESVGETYEIYYSNKDATNLVGEQSTFLETDTTELVRQMLEKIYTQPKNVEIIPVIQEEMLLDFALVEKQVTINMSTAYKELDTDRRSHLRPTYPAAQPLHRALVPRAGRPRMFGTDPSNQNLWFCHFSETW